MHHIPITHINRCTQLRSKMKLACQTVRRANPFHRSFCYCCCHCLLLLLLLYPGASVSPSRAPGTVAFSQSVNRKLGL